MNLGFSRALSPVWSVHLSLVPRLIFSFSNSCQFISLLPTSVHNKVPLMALSQGTVAYDGPDYHDLDGHDDESPRHPPSSFHMLDEKAPLRDQPGRTSFRPYSELGRHGTSPEALANANHEYPWRPGGFRRFPYLGYIPLILSIACKCSVRRCSSSRCVYTYCPDM